MVNSKDFAQDYNSYYRPSLDDDDKTFFPKQGMLPIYFFKNGVLQQQLEQTQYLRQETDDFEKRDQIEANYYIYFISILMFILFFCISKIIKQK